MGKNTSIGIFSSLVEERIPKLPRKYLPAPMMTKRLSSHSDSAVRSNIDCGRSGISSKKMKKTKSSNNVKSVSFAMYDEEEVKYSKDHKNKLKTDNSSNFSPTNVNGNCSSSDGTSTSTPVSRSKSVSESISGLESTVKELLQDYKPTSHERRPFWCRICLYQGTDLEDLTQHKNTESHQLAYEKERKLSYCKLCR